MKFGFLAHPVDPGQRHLLHAAGLTADLLGDRAGWPVRARRDFLPVPGLGTVTSATGAAADGEVRYLPYLAEDLLRRPEVTLGLVIAQVSSLAARGAAIVGLGGATSIVGNRGRRVAETTGVPVTSGNCLTAYAALASAQHAADLLDLPDEAEVMVIGYPGAIGLVLTRLLLDAGRRVVVVHRRGASGADGLLRYLPAALHQRVTLSADAAAAYSACRLIIGASSTGGLLDPNRLRPGTVVVDVALPRDVARPPGGRDDIVVLDGGLVSAVAGTFTLGGGPAGPTRLLNGCLAETLVLALERRAENWSLGRELDPAAVLDIGRLAARHGLTPSAPTGFGRAIADDDVRRLAAWHRPTDLRTRRPPSVQGDVTRTTADRFRRHVNPPLAALMTGHGIGQVFTSAYASTLVTADGTRFLDFVAGYGCLNLGHNPPAVVGRLRSFLDSGTPTFVQYVSMPVQTAELAERLCERAPGDLQRVFFSNSGAEAVEAALKLARAATGRNTLVHVDNSYHGKTFGALSVTGRAVHQQRFGPMLPGCVSVAYGDTAALAAVIGDAAAFIVEPVLGEGGVIVAPDGYLIEAQRLCRAAGAVFVVDEIQTGLGRTGAMFACEHWGLEPDVLCLAKSLSGGLIPIGATLATAAVWDSAYGSVSRSTLHSSTFGGGNLAAAAGLATLDALDELDLPARAAKLGVTLRRGLNEVAQRFSFIADVRGLGMMNAVAFDADLSGAFVAATTEVLTRLPGDLHEVADLLDDGALAALAGAGRALEATLGDLLCLRFVRKLANDHRILTFVTANRNHVLRIQPPLVLEDHEADRFIQAVADVATDLSFYADLTAR